MTINQIGSNSPAVMESRIQHKEFVDQLRMGAYNPAQSSLISLSQPQQEGVGDFFSGIASGLWSIVTWPFKALASLWAWMTGTSENPSKDNVEKEKSGAVADFLDLFKKDKEDDIDNESFREVYSGLNSEQKKDYRTMVWIADGFQEAATGKNHATKLVEKKTEFKSDEVTVLEEAADLFKAAPKLKSLGDRHAKLADKMIKDIDNDDSDADYEKDKTKLEKEMKKLPDFAKERLEKFEKILKSDDHFIFSKKERVDGTTRQEAHGLKALSYVLKTCHQNQFLALGTVEVRDELDRMVRVIGQKGKGESSGRVLATEGDITAEYNALSSAAKKAFAEAIGYKIGKPGSGEQYLLGKLKNDNEKIVPDRDMIMETLTALVKLDGGVKKERSSY